MAVLVAAGGDGEIPHPDEYREKFRAALFDPAPVEAMDQERVELLTALGLEV